MYATIIGIYLNKSKFNKTIDTLLCFFLCYYYFRQLDIFDIIKEVVFCRPCIDIVQELIHLLSKISIYTEITDSLCQLSCKLYKYKI